MQHTGVHAVKKNLRLLYPDFDESLQRHGLSLTKFNQFYANDTSPPLPQYILVKNSLQGMYERDRQKPFITATSYTIPPVIHQIWLGSPVPERYKKLMETWQRFPGWTYKLWTDMEVKTLFLENEDLYQSARNYGERSDILRYEILQRYGGVYIDVDVECLNPALFDFFHKRYRFYAGLEPLEWGKPLVIGNAIVASIPGHPVLDKLVKGLKRNWDACQAIKNQRPRDEDPYHSFETFMKTGPLYFTKKVEQNLDLLGADGLVFPPTFFIPSSPKSFLIETFACSLRRAPFIIGFIIG